MGRNRSETPGSGGWPSGSSRQETASIRTANAARTMNTHCQPRCTATKTPTLGASSGETPRIKISSEMILAVSCTGKKSRTMAMEATCAAHPPSACTKRMATSHSTVRENRQSTQAARNSVNPAYNGSLRPNRSSSGP